MRQAGSRLLGALALLVPFALLDAPAASADEAQELAALPATAYIINLDLLAPPDGSDAPPLDAAPGFGAASSPSGAFLPDASAYFDLGGATGEFTYLTPRVQGIQLSWTTQEDESAGQDRSHGIASDSYVSRPTSLGASFAQGGDDFEVSLGGDYGRASKSVPGMVRLVEDPKLLRVGAHARIHEFTLGGAFGSDVDPGNLGQTLSWDAFGRYDFGALAVGLVYNYTMGSDSAADGGGNGSGNDGGGATLQGGVSYFFTPRMAVTTNLAYGNTIDQGGDDSAIAGVLGFSLDF